MALWGGRFSDGPADAVFALSRSAHFDWRLASYDIRSSLAHLSVLESSKLVTKDDAAAIRAALKELASEVAKGSFVAEATDEDVHSALERGLTAKLGPVGGALRAGRSRNDQVTTDLRLFAIDHMLEVAALITQLNSAILKKASEYVNDSAPGFTHIQHAQPVSFGHELAKHAHAFARDLDRINDWFKRTSVSSLGAGALAGSSLPLDPARTAKNLGFDSTFANSIDAVSDRDYVAEALFICATVGLHLSRIGEEWTLWASTEFAWAKVADEYSTGSSIMPNKHNPDVIEIMRANYSIIAGYASELENLISLPSGYHRDLQLTKRGLVRGFDIALTTLSILPDLIYSIQVNKEQSIQFIDDDMKMTDRVYELVSKGMAFRDAYNKIKTSKKDGQEISGKLINSSPGSPGNLNLKNLKKRLKKQK